MRRRLGPLVVAAVTALCLLSLPVVAGGSPASQRAPLARHGAGPFSGAMNVIKASSIRSR